MAAAECGQVDVHTTARRTCENNIQDVLKEFYDISHHEVDVSRIADGHFRIKGPKNVTKLLLKGNTPKKWNIKAVQDSSMEGYNDKKSHMVVTITYSVEGLGKPLCAAAKNFKDKLVESHKISYVCAIMVNKIDHCVFYDCDHSLVTPLVKVDVTKYGDGIEDIVKSQSFRDLIECELSDCWIAWTYNGCSTQYWKQINGKTALCKPNQ